jgi:CRP-like cAMP-binding protein
MATKANMASFKDHQSQNRLLASLSAADYELLEPYLQPVDLKFKQTLYAADQAVKWVYFLEAGVASHVCEMSNGDAAEIGAIGNEGVVGLPVLFGDTQGPTWNYMQVAGRGLRIKSDVFWEQMERSNTLRLAILHYAHAYVNLLGQSAACAHFHSLEARCCRWLLMVHDRMHTDTFPLTHEFLAMMLGVRRAGVSLAASALKRIGLIKYTRGEVTILDYEGLRHRTCECYEISKREFDRLLGQKPRRTAKAKDRRGRAL